MLQKVAKVIMYKDLYRTGEHVGSKDVGRCILKGMCRCCCCCYGIGPPVTAAMFDCYLHDWLVGQRMLRVMRHDVLS